MGLTRQSASRLGVLAAVIGGCCAAFGDSPLAMPNRAEDVNITGGFTPGGPIATNWTAAGGAAADFNNDGLPDIFVVTGSTMPDRLYINMGNGTFENQAAEWGLTTVHSGNGVAVADFNSNGWLDIYVTSFGDVGDPGVTPGRNKLYRNDGQGGFANVATSAGVAWVHPVNAAGHGACWGDYNLNGHLDLQVSLWWPSAPMPPKLFKNNGNETFTDVSAAAGIATAIWGFQGAFADMNGNGWPDLLIAADFKSSRYYRNNGNGTFTNLAPGNGTGKDCFGMGQAIADVNNNGLLDWYVTSVEPVSLITCPLPGNTLYINQGNHNYVEMAGTMGVDLGAWGWGTIAVDLDHKGWVDLVEVNGRPAFPWQFVPPKLFYNNMDGTFDEIAVASGMFHLDQGRGVARLDADRDGRQDIFVTNFGEPWRYYRNETPDVGNWIGISFDTSNNPLLPPNGFGAHVTVTAGEHSWIRYMHGDPSYLATSELNVHFGLADAVVIDTITIRWPRGYVTTLNNVSVNQYLTVTGPALADLNANGSVGVADLLILLSKWGAVTTALDKHADLNNDGIVGVADLLILLANWG